MPIGDPPPPQVFRYGESAVWSTHIYSEDFSDLRVAAKGAVVRTTEGYFEKLSEPDSPSFGVTSFRLFGGNGTTLPPKEQLWREYGKRRTLTLAELGSLKPELLTDIEILAALGEP